jgi:hypothetical protein
MLSCCIRRGLYMLSCCIRRGLLCCLVASAGVPDQDRAGGVRGHRRCVRPRRGSCDGGRGRRVLGTPSGPIKGARHRMHSAHKAAVTQP